MYHPRALVEIKKDRGPTRTPVNFNLMRISLEADVRTEEERTADLVVAS